MMKAHCLYKPTPSVLTGYNVQLNTALYLGSAGQAAISIIEPDGILNILVILGLGGLGILNAVTLIKYRHAYMLPKVQVYYAIFASVICIASVLIFAIYTLVSLL